MRLAVFGRDQRFQAAQHDPQTRSTGGHHSQSEAAPRADIVRK
jgi:hypothetical protein